MQKIFVGVMAGAVNDEVLTVIHTIIDFIYYAQFQSHTTKTLVGLQKSLETFHAHKDIFIQLGVREHFNIPKLHNIQHYLDAILTLGSTDGFNSESPEPLHINLAKDVYHASNMHDYTEQMAVWLQRQEAVHLRKSYLLWCYLPVVDCEVISNADNDGDNNDCDDVHTLTAGSFVTKCSAKSPSPITWHVAKHPAFANHPITELEALYGAVDFLPMFSEFLWCHIPCMLKPSKYDRFDVYNQISIVLPFNHHISLTQPLKTRIQTTPARDSHGHHPPVPAHFDMALIIEDPRSYIPSSSFQGEFKLSLEIPASAQSQLST
jgi:hypothetical protein